MQIRSVLSHEELNRFFQNWAAPLKLPLEVTPNIRIARYEDSIVAETIANGVRLGFFKPDCGIIRNIGYAQYYPIINFINELNYSAYDGSWRCNPANISIKPDMDSDIFEYTEWDLKQMVINSFKYIQFGRY